MAPRAGGRGGRTTNGGDVFDREETARIAQLAEDRLGRRFDDRFEACTEQLMRRFNALFTEPHQHRNRAPNPRQEHEGGDLEGDNENPFADYNPRRREREHVVPEQRANRQWDFNCGKELTEFHGNLGPDEFTDWLAITEEILDLRGVPDDKRAPLVATKFRGRATAWWQQSKQTRLRQGKSKIVSWEKMKKHMRAAFLPYNYVRTLFQRLQNVRQGTRSIDDYTAEFYQLVARTDIGDSEDQLVSRYIGGMTVNFQDSLNMFDPVSVSEAHQRALHLERQFNHKSGHNNTYRSSGGGFANQSQARGITPSSVPPGAAVGESGLQSQPYNTGAITRSQNGITRSRCFTCGEPGHRAAECRQGGKYGKGLFVDSEGFDDSGIPEHEPVYDDKGDIQEELVEGNAGPLLVVRRTCFTPRDLSGDSWLRNNIFQSTCTINGKVCKMVIDPGSCENVISQEAVTKLNSPTEQHPQPYRLSWLKKGNVVTVTKRCLVQFSIGAKYKDKAWCDVVEMDACHLLLGRPWEFDTWATHDGRNNTYSFEFENNKIVLLPKKTCSANTKHNENASTSLFTRQQFVDAVEETRIDLAPAPDPKRIHGKAKDFDSQKNSRPTLLWYYKNKPVIISHKEGHEKQEKQSNQSGLQDPEEADRFSLFVESDGLTYCLYDDSERIVGNTYGTCILQDFEAVTPNLLAKTIEAVDGGGLYTTDVFNEKHLIPFRGGNSDDDPDANSRPNFTSPGENDAMGVALKYWLARNDKKREDGSCFTTITSNSHNF